ncbi:MAG: peptidase M3 [Flavobacteriia bacterium]|nr:MAG: peptidase M3 [Flavobacteriia bacterium]
MNPLIETFNTPYQTAPFSQLQPGHFLPAIEHHIQEAKAEIDVIVTNPERPNFENTIAALDKSGYMLGRVSSILFNLNSAETNPDIQKATQEVSPLLTDFNNDIKLKKPLFERVKTVWAQRDTLVLSPEQQTLLDKTYKSFTRNGALLDDKAQGQLRRIDKELAKLKLTFGEHVLADTTAYELHLTDEEDLKGLPGFAVDMARQTALQKSKEGWVFTLDFPSYRAMMTYSDHRHLRQQMAIAYGKRGFQANANNNETILLDIARLRLQRAQLLGYKTHADYVLQERMAETPETVRNFLDELLTKAKPFAEKEYDRLQDFANRKGLNDTLRLWDAGYYTEKLKKATFDLDDELLKPYFKLDNVVHGVFTIAHKLYGLNFEPIEGIDTYHKDVQTYKVTDDKGDFIAIFYTDFFPRQGKRNGAWMTSYKDQWVDRQGDSRPHISIVCNFTKPTDQTPSLLTFNEVTTLFHEFGHALHGMLAHTTYRSLSGTSVYWDFVELPSQLMENWAYEPEALALFAKHYQTGELIPMAMIEKIKASANFMEGLATVRQLSFGLLDMAWHNTEDLDAVTNIQSYEKQVMSPTQIYPFVDETAMSPAFSHIFQGGYSAGYYSYKWAEVLDADTFELFKETGIFNPDTALKFKLNILSQGGTEHPMTLYKRFRGREPKVEALLKRAGLV